MSNISEDQLIGSSWTPSFYGYDGHMNVRILSNSPGSVTDTYQFDAFGNQITSSTGTTSNNYLFGSELFDRNLSLYHLRARYYNLLTGRFVTRDPESGEISQPLTQHKYVYAVNDPVDKADPSGRDIIESLRLFYELPEVKITLWAGGLASLRLQKYGYAL